MGLMHRIVNLTKSGSPEKEDKGYIENQTIYTDWKASNGTLYRIDGHIQKTGNNT